MAKKRKCIQNEKVEVFPYTIPDSELQKHPMKYLWYKEKIRYRYYYAHNDWRKFIETGALDGFLFEREVVDDREFSYDSKWILYQGRFHSIAMVVDQPEPLDFQHECFLIGYGCIAKFEVHRVRNAFREFYALKGKEHISVRIKHFLPHFHKEAEPKILVANPDGCWVLREYKRMVFHWKCMFLSPAVIQCH